MRRLDEGQALERRVEAREGLDGSSEAGPAQPSGPSAQPRFGRAASTHLGLRALLGALALSAAAATGVAGQQRSGGEAWAIEAGGGAAGSLVGFGVGALMARGDCESEDLECYLDAVGRVVLTASAGATLATWALGRATGTEPSLLGTALGSLAGAFAGAGVIKLLDEASSGGGDGGGAVIGFSIAQGAVTALGSRIAASLR
jgi:hypothetical protein